MTRSIPAAGVREEGSAAARFGTLRFGGSTRTIEGSVSVGTTPTRIFANNPRRLAWRIYNRSTSDIDLGLAGTVTVGAGAPLPASTGWAESDVEIEGEEVLHDVWGIAAGAAGTVVTQEVVRQ